MKKLFLILITFCISNLYAQEKLLFEKVIKTDSIGIEQIYLKVNVWLAETFKNPQKVIQVADKESGLITLTALFRYSHSGISYSCYEGSVSYTMIIQIKPNRFRVELSNFKHSVNIGNSKTCELGLLTTAEIFSESGLQKKFNNLVWTDLRQKSEQESLSTFKSLEDYFSQKKNDW